MPIEESASRALGKPRLRFVLILITGAASLLIRLLNQYDFDRSALLYVGIPFAISLVLSLITADRYADRWWHGYLHHTQMAFIVFLASSIVLFEGFVCVLMFMPLYLMVIAIAYGIRSASEHSRRKNGTMNLHLAPLVLVGLSALEGTHESLSFARYNQVTVSRTVALSVADIKVNLAADINLQRSRHWLLQLFPMPVGIEAGSLAAGDVHRIHTRYHRWFFMNTHEGRMDLQIVSVEPLRVRTNIVEDTSYFSSYLTLHGTQIDLQPLADGRTEISLRIDFSRELDPAWYFHPLQRIAVKKMGLFLIDEIMIRDDAHVALP